MHGWRRPLMLAHYSRPKMVKLNNDFCNLTTRKFNFLGSITTSFQRRPVIDKLHQLKWSANPIFDLFRVALIQNDRNDHNEIGTGKSLPEALLFAEHGENKLCTKIVLNVRNNFCTQHVLSRFKLGIIMYWTICCHILGQLMQK